MVVSQEQKAGRSHRIKTGNKSFESFEQFKYLGKNSKHKKILFRQKLRAD
jgi:hypothetical protein